MYNHSHLALTGGAGTVLGVSLGWHLLAAFALVALGTALWRMRPERR